MPPKQPQDDAAVGQEIPVPLSALAQPDDQEQMQTPEPGDEVDMTVSAKITRVEGQTAYIQPTAINGNPLGAQGEEQDEQPDADAQEGSDLQAMAQQMSGGNEQD